MALQKLSENTWTLTRPLMAPGIGNIGARMTVLRLNTGELLLISPVKLEEGDIKQLWELGRIKALIAPNSVHHLFLKKAHEHFPEAEVMGPPGLIQKRKDILFNLVVDRMNWPFAKEVGIYILPARSPVNEEIIFFHHKDQVLVTTDFVFNLQKVEGFWPRIFGAINRTYKRFGMSTAGRWFFSDRSEIKNLLKQISEWKPQMIVMAHGDVIQSQALDQLKQSFAWLR